MAGSNPGIFAAIDGDPRNYIEFLDARTDIDDEVRVKQLIAGLLDIRPGMSVLDVGSGTGDDTLRVAELAGPDGDVVGIDHSQDMVDEARRRAGQARVPATFAAGDAQALEFGDACFDRTRAERVLIHLPDPVAAIGELVRVTKPGGLVVASDLDGGTIFLNSSDTALARGLVTAVTDGLANGWIGRRLHRYFVEAGLEDVRCLTTVIHNSVSFMRRVFAVPLQQLTAAGHTTGEATARFWAELDEGERAGWLCSGIVCFTVTGRKPAIR
jgi:ubiquinone/menaquinone biosynthesis C-methylase UbiE